MIAHAHVRRNVGLNPVAQAMAREQMRKAMLDQKIEIYLLADGDDCAGLCAALGLTLAVIGMATELDPAQNRDGLELRILRGGLSALAQMSASGRWARINAPALDRAIDAAMTLCKAVKPIYINQAYRRLAQ